MFLAQIHGALMKKEQLRMQNGPPRFHPPVAMPWASFYMTTGSPTVSYRVYMRCKVSTVTHDYRRLRTNVLGQNAFNALPKLSLSFLGAGKAPVPSAPLSPCAASVVTRNLEDKP